jgi:formimidoylglutamate deiminase
VTVSDDGLHHRYRPGRSPHRSAERIAGIVIPGMPNAHSHAFQRAMAGAPNSASRRSDSFWTWRAPCTRLANRIEPEELQILATQLFIEMLKAGYTSVAEFHYLHRRTDGVPYAGSNNALWEAVRDAATTAGIGLTFLPTLYQPAISAAHPLTPGSAICAGHRCVRACRR